MFKFILFVACFLLLIVGFIGLANAYDWTWVTKVIVEIGNIKFNVAHAVGLGLLGLLYWGFYGK